MAAARLPGVPRLLRELNDRAALELLLAHGPLTRTQLGALTGLSKVTASQLVERLEVRGLVSRVGELAGGRGPHAQLYAVTPGSAHVIGGDVRPDRVVVACADITGSVISRVCLSTADVANPAGVVHRAVRQAAAEAGAELSQVRRIVLGTPGAVDPRTGDIAFAWNLPDWYGGLLGHLRDDLIGPGVPHSQVVLANDVNLAAMAEANLGAGRSVEDFVLFWIGRGVGLAVVLGGRLHTGDAGAAGEIGYLPVPGAGLPRDPSRRGLDGAFQSLANVEAVHALAHQCGFPAGTAADAVRAAVTAGDERGESLLDELGRRLALGVAAACVVIDPPLVVLAGDIGRAGGAALASRIEREVPALTLATPRIVVTEVPDEPVLHGALHTALDAVREEIFGSTTH